MQKREMIDKNIQFSQLMLRTIRAEAKKEKVKIPKKLTALRSSFTNFFLVEGDGFRKEVEADNAYDAKYKIISKVIRDTVLLREAKTLGGSSHSNQVNSSPTSTSQEVSND